MGAKMIRIVNSYVQTMPSVRFAGIQYGDEDRVDGGFGQQWGEWFQSNRFEPLEALIGEKYKSSYEDAEAYIGLMRCKDGEPFQYWIGMFLPENSQIPSGYDFIDIPEAKIGACWLHGPEQELYCNEEKCADKLKQDGLELIMDEEGAWWFFERYACPRFTEKDEENQVILDICHYVK